MHAWSRTQVGAFVWLAVALGGLGCSASGGDDSSTQVNGTQGGSTTGSVDSGGSSSPGNPIGSQDSGSSNPGQGSGPTGPSQDAGSGSADAGTHHDGGGHHDAGGGNGQPDATTPPDMDSSVPADDSGDSLTAARAQCVQIINAYRATLNPPSPPLTEDTSKESCVDSQAQKDYTAMTAHSAFGQCNEFAQDECPGWPGPPASINTDCLKSMWDEGPPPAGQDNHWLNMSNAQYTKVACGYYQTPQGDWWTTQDFW